MPSSRPAIGGLFRIGSPASKTREEDMEPVRLRDPAALVSTNWLADHLSDPSIRVFDCTTRLVADASGQRPYIAEPCLQEYEAGHIPGAGYLDLQRDFSHGDSPYGMTLAEPVAVAAAFARNGISNDSRVARWALTCTAARSTRSVVLDESLEASMSLKSHCWTLRRASSRRRARSLNTSCGRAFKSRRLL